MKTNDQITISPQQFQAAADLAAVLRGGGFRDPATLSVLGDSLSYSRRRPRAFMHPAVAAKFGAAGREYLGGQWQLGDAAQRFAQPSLSDVHVDAVLTSISVKYINTMYIGGLACPRVHVVKESDKYFTFGQSAFLRNDARMRAPSTRAATVGYTVSTDNYSCEEYAVETPIDDRLRSNADNPLNPDRDGAELVADKIDMIVEQEVQSLVETSGNWTTNVTLSGTDQWSDYANSDPFDDVKTARLTVLKQVQRKPNTAIMGIETFETLALHPDLLDRVKYTGTGEKPAMVTAQMMAELFQLDQVLVGAAVEDTAVEGATASLSFIWGKHCWIGFVAPQPALATPSAMYTFTTGRIVDRYRDEPITSDVVRAREGFDVKKVAGGAGYRIINAVA